MHEARICMDCQIQLRVETSGIFLAQMTNGGIMAVWAADQYKCLRCRRESVSPVGSIALAREELQSMVLLVNNKYATHALRVIPYWLNLLEKDRFDDRYESFEKWLEKVQTKVFEYFACKSLDEWLSLIRHEEDDDGIA